MSVTFYKIGEVCFHFIGCNGFNVKKENYKFNAVSWRCRHNVKFENFTSLYSIQSGQTANDSTC